MPKRETNTRSPISKMKESMLNLSWEYQLACWFQRSGWEVFWPLSDVGQKTDFLISDGKNFHRIQVKALAANSFKTTTSNKWGRKTPKCDYVIVILKGCGQGICFKAIDATSATVNLNTVPGNKFKQTHSGFMKAFNKT